MDIPVSGFMYASDGLDPMHSHRLYITSWDGRTVHVHSITALHLLMMDTHINTLERLNQPLLVSRIPIDNYLYFC